MSSSLYDSTQNPDIAKGWILEVKKKINALNVPACFRFGLATYKLNENVDYW